MTTKMRAAVIDRYRQPQPTIQSVARPTMQPHDVLVKVMAASLNPIDHKTKDGAMRLLLHYQFPLILGSDFAGEIVAVGSAVTTFQVGDAVYGRPRKDRIGTFAEYLAIDADDIALKPKNLSYVEAAAIPLVGLTSYQALHDLMDLKAGDKVLIQAGAGGIGTLAIQLAKQLGAEVATTTSASHVELVRQLGADHIIDYHQTDFSTTLHDYDAVFDTLGGKNLARAFQILKPGGQVVSIAGRPDATFARQYGLPGWKVGLFKLATRQLTKLAQQYQSQYQFLFMWPSGTELAKLTMMFEQNRLRTIIDRTFAFEQLEQAMAYAEQGHATGKVVIEIGTQASI
ncbi:NADP-dependent oxidoreductase [Lactiplantibacillus daowaiensis]|uniref:NADP-dependent oxidoreductase n=1 Tax=Lactiplantibacillus daowaiensis TaxID=2559918 RepID=A0ABW1RZS9_9LACO|nr:NADP-dependent oxidoreductase [Lactiplantibacillus daowaiensis]